MLEYEMAILRLNCTEEKRYTSVNHGLREPPRRSELY